MNKNELRSEYEKRHRSKTPFNSLTDVIEIANKLTTATDFQKTIFKLIDGMEFEENDKTQKYIGDCKNIVGKRPKEITILSGVRTGKTLLASSLAIWWTQVCDLSSMHFKSGEYPRVSCLSLTKDLAKVAFKFIVGAVLSNDFLRSILVSEPTAESLFLMHPTGIPIEIKVTAGARAGGALVSRWSAGVIFDEISRMSGNDESVISYDDARDAILGRLLPNAQILSISSPYGTTGPAYQIFNKYFQSPTVDHVVVNCPAWELNPVWWTEERCAEIRNKSPEIYQCDVLGKFIDDDKAFFDSQQIMNAATNDNCNYIPGVDYVAAIDPATRSNDWTLIVAGEYADKTKHVVLAQRWGNQKTKSPMEIFAEISEICKKYNIKIVSTDQWSADPLREIAAMAGINLRADEWNSAQNYENYQKVWLMFSQRLIRIPHDAVLMNDLIRVRRKITSGSIRIELPLTADGRHCDYAPAFVRAMVQFAESYQEPIPKVGTKEYAEYEEKLMEDFAIQSNREENHWI